jgi:hypothetical protein
VRSTSARAAHVRDVQPEVIEKAHGVIGDHRDPPAPQPCRSPEAGPIRNDYPNPEAIVGFLVRMSRVPRPRHTLESQERPTARRTVLAPRQRPTIAQRQPTFAHSRVMFAGRLLVRPDLVDRHDSTPSRRCAPESARRFAGRFFSSTRW